MSGPSAVAADDAFRLVELNPFLYRGHHIRPTAPRRNLWPQWEDATWVLVTCLDGTLTIEASPRRAVLRPGASAMAEPGHRLKPGERARGTLINFDLVPRTGRTWRRGQVYPPGNRAAAPQPTWSSIFGDDHPLLVPEAMQAAARQLTSKLASARTKGGPDHLVANLELARWIVDYARFLGRFAEAEPPSGGGGTGEPADGDEFALRVERKIWISLSDGLTVLDLAAHFGIDRSTLERRYHAQRGRSVHAAIDDERCRRARERLRNTEMSMAEVAGAIGFGSAATFSTWFRRHHGTTPSRWRLQQRL